MILSVSRNSARCSSHPHSVRCREHRARRRYRCRLPRDVHHCVPPRPRSSGHAQPARLHTACPLTYGASFGSPQRGHITEQRRLHRRTIPALFDARTPPPGIAPRPPPPPPRGGAPRDGCGPSPRAAYPTLVESKLVRPKCTAGQRANGPTGQRIPMRPHRIPGTAAAEEEPSVTVFPDPDRPGDEAAIVSCGALHHE